MKLTSITLTLQLQCSPRTSLKAHTHDEERVHSVGLKQQVFLRGKVNTCYLRLLVSFCYAGATYHAGQDRAT